MNVTEYAVIVRLYTGGQVLCIIGYLCMHEVYMYIHIRMYVCMYSVLASTYP